MTDKRTMSPEEALASLASWVPAPNLHLERDTLRAYIADTQEIVRLAREVVKSRISNMNNEDLVCPAALYALRDRLEQHDAK